MRISDWSSDVCSSDLWSMTSRSPEDLARELDFYRGQCNDLGARVLRLQEAQSRAHREARRSRPTAKLIREAYGLVGLNASLEPVGRRMHNLIIAKTAGDSARENGRDKVFQYN